MLTRLLELLFPPREDEKLIRTLSEEYFLSRLDPQLEPLGNGTLATSLLPFTDPCVRAAVHEAKYRGNEQAFNLLAAALADYLREMANESEGFGSNERPTRSFILVPVPLGSARRKERGFNQVEEVLLRAIKYLKFQDLKTESDTLALMIASDLLIRTRDTVSQVSLPRRERIRNMTDAFSCPAKLEERSMGTYIVCDDVLTTGATLSAACSALSAAGATNVLAIAFAH